MEEHQKFFDSLKKALVESPILGYPKAEGTFILDTNVSHVAIGAKLLQLQDYKEVVISYGSYILTPAQGKYCTTRKEFLAVVRFTCQYRHYLLCQKFVVRTYSLTWLMRFRHIEGQLARWLEELSQFDMVVQHRSGKQHGNADSVSRIPDSHKYCNCYEAGVSLSKLLCQGCRFCQWAHEHWSRFKNDVDDIVPIAIKAITLEEVEAWEEENSSQAPRGMMSSTELEAQVWREQLEVLQHEGALVVIDEWEGDEEPGIEVQKEVRQMTVRQGYRQCKICDQRFRHISRHTLCHLPPYVLPNHCCWGCRCHILQLSQIAQHDEPFGCNTSDRFSDQ